MIRGRPGTLSGSENNEVTDRLMDRDSVDRTSLRVNTRARFKRKNESRVKSSFVGFGSCVERTY